MSEAERARVVVELPGEVTWDEMAMPDGDLHTQAKMGAWQALNGFLAWQRRRVYLGSELPVYYPAERRFAPDLVVVLDAEAHPRNKWVVSHEGKGLDWVLEVHVGGDRKNEAEFNVQRYARLGISEYFIYDRAHQRLHGYRLPSSEAKQYVPIVPECWRYESQVLGLELQVEAGRLRFWAGNALLLEDEERIAWLQEAIEWLRQRTNEEAQRREEETRRLAEARAELERLKQRGP